MRGENLSGTRWTEQELRILIAYWPKIGTRGCMTLLPERSSRAISQRACLLSLKSARKQAISEVLKEITQTNGITEESMGAMTSLNSIDAARAEFSRFDRELDEAVERRARALRRLSQLLSQQTHDSCHQRRVA